MVACSAVFHTPFFFQLGYSPKSVHIDMSCSLWLQTIPLQAPHNLLNSLVPI